MIITRKRKLIAVSFLYSIQASSTSAGIYTQDGTLVRTLWSGEQKQAGTYSVNYLWDGKDNTGALVSDGSYQVKVVSNNVTYEWEGVIGNTSTNTTGSARHKFTDRIWDMCIVGNTAYYCVGYVEGIAPIYRFSTSTPNIPDDVLTETADLTGANLASHVVCSDGTTVYWGGQDPYADTITGVYGTKISDNTAVAFSSGVSYTAVHGRTYNLINKITGASNADITGIAVQASGNYLFVARQNANTVHVLNKTTGALSQTLPITAPGRMVTDGSSLWIISGTNTVAKYTVNSDGTLTTATLTLSGLIKPVAISITGTSVIVADSGSSQQYKAFNTTSGASSWTHGQAGGYVNSPLVADDKFCFINVKEIGTKPDISFIAVQSDGSMWLGDGGNQRTIRVNSARTTKLDEIINLGYHYAVQADRNAPGRIFSNYLEWERDYTKTLQVGNGSWKLKQNWVGNVIAAKDDQASRLLFVSTLSNGRTYAFARITDGFEICELSSTGLRYTGITTPNLSYSMDKDGNLFTLTNSVQGLPVTWQKKTLTGFDGSNNPTHGSLTTIASIANFAVDDPISYSGGMYANQITSTGKLITFCADQGSTVLGHTLGTGYHLGAVNLGDTKWLWRSAPSTLLSYVGDFPSAGDYDIGNGGGVPLNYAGILSTVLDRNIFWNYSGEGWKSAQTNKFNHFLDNGLFVGQFGTTREDALGVAPAKMAGNIKNYSVVKVGSDYYLYHCDESYHSGTHVWKISGLSTIQEQTINITKSGTPVLPAIDYVDLMAGLPYNGILTNNTAGWTRNPTTDNVNGPSNTWSVTTNRTTYKSSDRDLRIESRPPTNGLTRTVSRDLGNNSLSVWRIEGQIGYPEQVEGDYNYIEVLDASDKVIVRISRPLLGFPTIDIKANSTTMVTGSIDTLFPIIKKLQPFSIARSGINITVTYANYTPVIVSAFDGTANLSTPKTFKITLFDAGTAGRMLDVARLRMS